MFNKEKKRVMSYQCKNHPFPWPRSVIPRVTTPRSKPSWPDKGKIHPINLGTGAVYSHTGKLYIAMRGRAAGIQVYKNQRTNSRRYLRYKVVRLRGLKDWMDTRLKGD